MIPSFLHWFERHRLFNLLLVCGYVLLIIFAHSWFVELSVGVMKGLSIPVYNKLVATITLGFAIGVVGLVAFAFKHKEQVRKIGIVFLSLNLVGLIIHFFVFTEMNIEFVHAMEYGLLATLIYPLVRTYSGAIIWSLPVMLFDEWYQYQVLFDYVEYFEFNDILLDLLGAGLFLSILMVFNRDAPVQVPLSKRPEVFLLLLVVVSAIVLIMSSTIVPYASEASENTWLILNDIQEPHGFWREHPLIGSIYHVLEPITGLITVFSVCAFYFLMDFRSSEK